MYDQSALQKVALLWRVLGIQVIVDHHGSYFFEEFTSSGLVPDVFSGCDVVFENVPGGLRAFGFVRNFDFSFWI
jgi:NADPH-dependent curcumin reductase CurA